MEAEGVMEDTLSISKGCFLFNPKASAKTQGSKKRIQKKRSIRKATQYFTGNKFPLLKGEREDDAMLRYECFKDCWANISLQIESIQVAMNQKVFDELLSFIKNTHATRTSKFSRREVPTAALLTGVNMPDHDLILQQITTSILSDISPHVALLHSKDCSNLKFLLREVVTQLMSGEDDNDDQEEDFDKSCIKVMGKLKHHTLGVLKSWYTRNSASSSDQCPIVIIFEDFEGFQKSILQDFILICSEHIEDLPIVFVFSLATTLATIHHVLPHSVSTRLVIEAFQAEPSLHCLHQILNKVLLTPQHPFKLGPKMLHLLYDNFLCQDFSIHNFSSAVQVAMLEHFYSNQLSILCSHDTDLTNSAIKNLTENQIDKLLSMQSFQRFRDRKSLSEQKKLTEDSAFIKKTAKALLQDIRNIVATVIPVLHCLQRLSSRIPGVPFGKRFKDAYELCLKQEIIKTEKYQSTIALLRQISKDDLLALLKECNDVLENAIEADERCECFVADVAQLESLLARFDSIDEQQSQINAEAEAKSSKASSKIQIYKNRFEFQERMRQAVKEKKSSPYDKLRNEVIDFWDQTFKKYIRCPMLLPLNEIYFFDAVCSIVPHINPAPRLAIHNALKRPHDYLWCKCCNIDAEDNHETLPDLSIIYKIHLECGRMINLYDWLQAFIAVVEPVPTSRRNSKKRQAEDESLQSRFVQSVSEMQFLGLIKPTKRKTDHVQRLTWGF